MGLFATRSRPTPRPGTWEELSEAQRAGVPLRFEAVGEAQVSGISAVAACREAGRLLAGDGASLEEVLEGLRVTARLACGREPAYDELVAVSVAWSEATLGYLHRLTCDDPMTGLATQPHLRARLAEAYRLHADVHRHLALVVVESQPARDQLTQALGLSRVGRSARTVFGSEVIAGVGSRRVVVAAERDGGLAGRVALLRRLVGGSDVRVWIEGLPGSDAAAGALLDELARC